MTEPTRLRIDFVSDIACPWCAIGLAGLQAALARLADRVQADIHLQPFELEPEMPFEGVDAGAHLMRKYGIDEAQLEANRSTIRERAAALGVTIAYRPGTRVWNTFDAHRLLHWAALQDSERTLGLQKALFHAYFADNENVGEHEVLVRLAADAGFDADDARRMLESGEYADDVRTLERHYQQGGIRSVPATIVDNRYLISGGQPPEAFERTLDELARGRQAPDAG
ncbi:MAG: DsbA family oxidoreductase [Burkholderiaceae bacterium]|jgi:predicted DsbA family dithiol-disulfide isomerase|nr:DsbA family oxidoreductase [Burkholderiaceae bacterium]